MRHRRVLIIAGVLVFLAVSFQLARVLTAGNTERAAVYALLEAEARGDAPGVAARLDTCAEACRREVATTVARARRPGEVKILRLDSAANFRLGTRTARSRVAWAADATAGGAAVVQCITVRRSWSFLSGASVSLMRLSAPLPPETGC